MLREGKKMGEEVRKVLPVEQFGYVYMLRERSK